MTQPNTTEAASRGESALERVVRPLAWALTHRDGRVTLHLDAEYATAYRDTCVKETPLYAPQEEAEFTVLAGDEDGDELDFVAGSRSARAPSGTSLASPFFVTLKCATVPRSSYDNTSDALMPVCSDIKKA